jgi:hypothetical protein
MLWRWTPEKNTFIVQIAIAKISSIKLNYQSHANFAKLWHAKIVTLKIIKEDHVETRMRPDLDFGQLVIRTGWRIAQNVRRGHKKMKVVIICHVRDVGQIGVGFVLIKFSQVTMTGHFNLWCLDVQVFSLH